MLELLEDLSAVPSEQFKALLLSPYPICVDDKSMGIPADIDQPMRVSQAIATYIATRQAELKPRTLEARISALQELVAHMGLGTSDDGFDPWLHQIAAYHLTSYFNSLANGGVRRKNGAAQAAVSPSTIEARMSHLAQIFEWARDEAGACKTSPMGELARRRGRNRARMNKEDEPYPPFTNHHLRTIFDPAVYLEANSKADLFWAPLLAGHLGMRLSEIVSLTIDAITQSYSGIWSIQVTKINSKTDNSVRKVPVSDLLIELGFIRYVEHVRALGASRLFPHRAMSKTACSKPYKVCSESFSNYLKARGIKGDGVVFHSFRHTVISEMSTIGVPVAIAQNITGHAAQEAALKSGELTDKEARSVFFKRYTQLSVPRMNVDCPLAPLKYHIDRISLPIDYARIKIAAEIVRKHTIRTGKSFESGWATQNKKYASAQIALLTH